MNKRMILLVMLIVSIVSNAQPLQWAGGLLGAANIYAEDIIVSPLGHSYSTGQFAGQIDFDPGPGTFQLTSGSGSGCYIVKLDSDGNFGWARQIEMISWNAKSLGLSIGIDHSGNIYTVGRFRGTGDFDPGPGIHNLTSNGEYDIFLLKLDSLGNFIYARQMGGTGNEAAESLTIDNNDNVFIAGGYSSTVDFDPGSGTHNLTADVEGDIYVLKLDTQANFQWCKTFGVDGEENDLPSIRHDNAGNIFLGVRLNSNMCIIKLDAQGSILFSKTINNPGNTANAITGIGVDNSGNVLATGVYYATTDFDPGVGLFNLDCAGETDVFILKLDNNGNFTWVKGIGNQDYEIAEDITTDANNSVYITGFFLETVDFDPGPGVYILSAVPNLESWQDIFLLKLSEQGNFLSAAKMGGKSIDDGRAIDIDVNGNCYLTGTFSDTCDFDPGPGNVSLVSSNFNTSSYVIKLGSTLGITEEKQNKEYVEVYPNPVANTFYVSSPKIIHSIAITDMLGKVVYRIEPENYLNKIDIDVSPGIYNVSMNIGDEVVVRKVMVK